jgi:hypothetical protein
MDIFINLTAIRYLRYNFLYPSNTQYSGKSDISNDFFYWEIYYTLKDFIYSVSKVIGSDLTYSFLNLENQSIFYFMGESIFFILVLFLLLLSLS